MDLLFEWLSGAKDILIMWVGLVIAGLFVLTAAIKGTVRFDLNEWLRDRRKQTKDKIRIL